MGVDSAACARGGRARGRSGAAKIMFRAAVLAVPAATAVAMLAAGGAGGAFPGSNGKIAFVNDRNGSPAIFTMDPDGSDISRLVPNEPQGAYPAASPNGNTIIFSVRVASSPAPQYALWRMKSDGSHIGRFIEGSSSLPCAATWSHDGSKVAFYRDGSLWIGSANHRSLREVTAASFSGAAPSWSSRGRIAFDRAGSIWVLNPKTGTVRDLGRGSQPSWSPDGRKLVFVAQRGGSSNNDLYVMRADGSGRQRLLATPTINEAQPSWSPGGRWIAFAQPKGVYVMSANGTGAHLVVPGGRQPTWIKGPQGLVVMRPTPVWNGILLRMSTNGKRETVLSHPNVDAAPAWSPDGTQLAFTRDGVVNLVSQFGGALTSIGLKGSDPAWSPDGKSIVVASGLDLVVANADGTDAHPLGIKLDPAAYASVSEPNWSPDGREIAFVATDTSGLRHLYVFKLRSGVATELRVGCDTIGADSPSWSPQGQRIAFACDQSIAITNDTGANPVPIGSAENAELAWSPDGSQIVYSERTGDQPASIFLVNSDGTVPTQVDIGAGSSDQPDWQPIVLSSTAGR
jgi:Tol biopolymer transport system component